jgi:DNA-binding MarR family transcriptional regulator
MNLEQSASSTSDPGFDFREFTFWVVRHQQAIADRLRINITDFKCLGVLHRMGPMTPKALATQIALSTAAMTTVIDRLEKAGYVRRKRDSTDRRSLTVHATPESRKQVTRMYRSLQEQRARLNGAYTREELRLVFRYLQQATVALRAATAALLRVGRPE